MYPLSAPRLEFDTQRFPALHGGCDCPLPYRPSGQPLGIISTHFRQPHRPSERELRFTDFYARQASDMIERRLAEQALQESQATLTRVARIASMGELTTSIAHEVNQPLTAIVTNSNFCLRLLDGAKPNTGELREAIAEIANDGIRASAVISRIRALLMRRVPDRAELDINKVIQGVTGLVRSEVSRNRICLLTDLTADLRVRGDRVQLQQVLINLIMNGIEAMRTLTDRPRELLIELIKALRWGVSSSEGLRIRNRSWASRSCLRTILYHKTGRHRDGVVDQPLNYRIPRWTSMGCSGAQWRPLRIYFARSKLIGDSWLSRRRLFLWWMTIHRFVAQLSVWSSL